MPVRLVALDECPDITLDRTIVVIGRHPDCDTRLDSLRVSRHHCCMRKRAARSWCGTWGAPTGSGSTARGSRSAACAGRRAVHRAPPLPARERPGARADDRRAGGPGGTRSRGRGPRPLPDQPGPRPWVRLGRTARSRAGRQRLGGGRPQMPAAGTGREMPDPGHRAGARGLRTQGRARRSPRGLPSGAASESRELQGPAVEGMRKVGDCDLAIAFFRDRRGITLGEA